MSKELEALKVLKANAILFDDGTDFGASMLEAIIDLEKALTPPTAEEVRRALSERYNNAGVQYLKDSKSFVFGYMLRPICWLKEDGTIYWATNDLPPHLITLIGRLYEAQQ